MVLGALYSLDCESPLAPSPAYAATIPIPHASVTYPRMVLLHKDGCIFNPASPSSLSAPVPLSTVARNTDASSPGIEGRISSSSPVGIKSVTVNFASLPDAQLPARTPSVTSAPSPVAPSSVASSPVVLSTATADTARSTITLVFTGPLDAQSAHNATRYGVAVNNIILTAEAAQLRGDGTVVILLPAGSLTSGCQLSAVWSGVLDDQGLPLQGRAELTVP